MYHIRQIESQDNEQVAGLIRDVLVEMGVPKIGTAYEDKSLDNMTAEYQGGHKKYFIVEENGKIIGGSGIAPLIGEPEICELQKMYFLPEARGRGIGAEMMKICLHFGKEAGYKKCYLETFPYMQHARKLYERTGFTSLNKAMGETGHYNCTIWMIKDL